MVLITRKNGGGWWWGWSSIILKTDWTNNGSQSILDLKAGPNITLTDDGFGWITMTATGWGDMYKSVYDVNNNGIVDNSQALWWQAGSYYLDRTNHTGTQTASTISDFSTTVSTNSDVSANTSARHTHSNKTILDNTTASYTTAEQTKLSHITVTQAVDLDQLETRVNELDAAVILKGTWDASSGVFPWSWVAQAGWSYIVSVAGTVNSVSFWINDRIIAITDNASTSTFANNWFKADYTDQVLSVAGKTGTVTLDKNDVWLGNVDNTTDLNKPISTATQTALDAKIAKATNVTSIRDTGILDWHIAVFNLTNKDIRTSSQTIVTTLWSNDSTVPTSKAVKDVTDTKVTANGAITWATKTKITYDAKWLVTAWADATTADIADSTNKRYVTDAQLTVVSNTSGTNTGDETTATVKSKLWQATTSTDGWLSSANWNTFNSKEWTITAGTTAQYWRGDKSWQALDKSAVWLSNVDNTSDTTKNSSTATLTNKTISGTNNTITNIAEWSLALTDITTNNATSARHGFLPKLENSGTKYLRDDWTWQTVSGGSTLWVWYALTGTFASTTTFTFSGDAWDAEAIERSLFTCLSTGGSTRRIGYVKSASHSGGTVTVTVVTDSDLASWDNTFKVALNRKIEDYEKFITIPWEQIADASNPQGMFYRGLVDSYLLPVNSFVRTAAAGAWAACAWNVYKWATNLFTSAQDLWTASTFDEKRPNTNTISSGDIITLRVTSSAWATNKASNLQVQLFIVPQTLYTTAD